MMSGNGQHAAWYWGKTEDEANQICDTLNAKMGITKADQQTIVLSSMPGFTGKLKSHDGPKHSPLIRASRMALGLF